MSWNCPVIKMTTGIQFLAGIGISVLFTLSTLPPDISSDTVNAKE